MLIAAVLVHSATAVAVSELATGRAPQARATFRAVFARFRPLVRAMGRAVGILVGLVITVVGIPLAVDRAVRWIFLPQMCVLEQREAKDARRASMRLVRGTWWRTFTVDAIVNVSVLLAGPIIGVLFVFFVSELSLSVVNVIGSVVYTVAYPYVGIATTLLYYDRSTRAEAAK